MTITIGIDPGKTGAIALIDSYGVLIDSYDMPMLGNLVSPHGVASLEMWATSEFGTVIIEDVHAMPKNGAIGSFSLGRSKGVVEGVFAALARPIVYVSPQKWKKALGVTSDKGGCRRRATELWPGRAELFKRVKDDGRAEAALVAYWWLQHGQIGGSK